jgi:hypothetical protein
MRRMLRCNDRLDPADHAANKAFSLFRTCDSHQGADFCQSVLGRV